MARTPVLGGAPWMRMKFPLFLMTVGAALPQKAASVNSLSRIPGFGGATFSVPLRIISSAQIA